MYNKKYQLFSVLFFSISILIFILFSFTEFGRSGSLGFDFKVFYNAGVDCWNNINPWIHSIEQGTPFSYPPHSLLLFSLYSLLTFKNALFLHSVINCLCLVVLCLLANKWYLKIRSIYDFNIRDSFSLIILFCNPFVLHTMFQGQITLICVTALLLVIYFNDKENLISTCFFLALATFKPQVSFLYVIWILFNKKSKVVFLSGFFSLLFMLPFLLKFGIESTFMSWIQSMEFYQSKPANQLGFQHLIGIESLLFQIGIRNSTVFARLSCIISFLILFFFRKRVSSLFSVLSLFIISLTFLYAHDSDLVILSFFFSIIFFQSYIDRRKIIITSILLLITFLPQRILRQYNLVYLYQWRTVSIIIIYIISTKWNLLTNLNNRINNV